MEIENPLALHFIMQDDLFFLKKDKALFAGKIAAPIVAVAEAAVEDVVAMVAEPVAVPGITFNYLGKGKKNFLILVHYPQFEFIAEAHLNALENILKRKDMLMDDVSILNMAHHGAGTFENIASHFKPKKVLFLGKNALPQGIGAISLNQPKVLADIAALFSFSFDEMMDNNDHKKAFWEQMKLL